MLISITSRQSSRRLVDLLGQQRELIDRADGHDQGGPRGLRCAGSRDRPEHVVGHVRAQIVPVARPANLHRRAASRGPRRNAQIFGQPARSCLHSQGNVLGFQEGVEPFAAQFPSPAALLYAAEGALAGGGHGVVDADRPGFERFGQPPQPATDRG